MVLSLTGTLHVERNGVDSSKIGGGTGSSTIGGGGGWFSYDRAIRINVLSDSIFKIIFTAILMLQKYTR